MAFTKKPTLWGNAGYRVKTLAVTTATQLFTSAISDRQALDERFKVFHGLQKVIEQLSSRYPVPKVVRDFGLAVSQLVAS